MDSRPNLFGMDREALANLVRAQGAPLFHGGQIYRWLYHKHGFEIAAWSDLPQALRERLAECSRVDPGRLTPAARADDGTIKYRVDLAGGQSVESVFMQQDGRVTLCLSSQVGCALDCAFCLTGKMGFRRHLSAGEIAGQVALIQQDRGLHEQSVNIVLMGMGEPLHNYDSVMAAFRLLTDPKGFGISRRRITISTAGLVPAIDRLATEPSRPRLAVSLNATSDELRSRVMPINRKYPLEQLLDACRRFSEVTGDRFTFEYVLLGGINDRTEDVERLAGILRRHRSKLNLIPFNSVPELLEFHPPTRERTIEIRDRLLSDGLRVSIRWSRGADARAACGQLALLEPPRS